MSNEFYEEIDQKVYMVRESSYLTPYQGTKATALTAEYPHLIPISIVTEGFDYELPRRLHEKLYGIGGGKHPTAIANTKQEPVTITISTKMQTAQFLSYAIAANSGSVTPTGSTYQVAEISCVAEGSLTQSGYFFLDVTDTDGTADHYVIWLDIQSGGADPAVGFGCTAVEVDIATDNTAQDVSDAITSAIDALDHVTATNGGGSLTTVTVTGEEGLGGACINIRDGEVATGLSFETTTKGVTTHTITEGTSSTTPSFTLHIEQRHQSTEAEDYKFDLFGCVVNSHTMTIDYENALVGESVEILCPHYVVGNRLTNLPPQFDADHEPLAWVNLAEAATKYLLMEGTNDITPPVVTKAELSIKNNTKLLPEIGYSYAQHPVSAKREVTLNIVGFTDNNDRLNNFIDTWTNSSTPANSYYTTQASRLNSVIKLERDATTDYIEIGIYNWYIDSHGLKVFNIEDGILGLDITLSDATPDANKRIISSLIVVDYLSDFQYE